MMTRILIISLLLLFTSCSWFSKEDKVKVEKTEVHLKEDKVTNYDTVYIVGLTLNYPNDWNISDRLDLGNLGLFAITKRNDEISLKIGLNSINISSEVKSASEVIKTELLTEPIIHNIHSDSIGEYLVDICKISYIRNSTNGIVHIYVFHIDERNIVITSHAEGKYEHEIKKIAENIIHSLQPINVKQGIEEFISKSQETHQIGDGFLLKKVEYKEDERKIYTVIQWNVDEKFFSKEEWIDFNVKAKHKQIEAFNKFKNLQNIASLCKYFDISFVYILEASNGKEVGKYTIAPKELIINYASKELVSKRKK